MSALNNYDQFLLEGSHDHKWLCCSDIHSDDDINWLFTKTGYS